MEEKKPKPKNYRRNFWLSILMTIASALAFSNVFFVNGASLPKIVLMYICTLAPSMIVWIIFLAMKKEGAHGWINGALVFTAVSTVVLGGCSVLYYSFPGSL